MAMLAAAVRMQAVPDIQQAMRDLPAPDPVLVSSGSTPFWMAPQNTRKANGMDSRSFCTIRRQRVSLSSAILSCFSSMFPDRPIAHTSCLSSAMRVLAANDLRACIMDVARNLT
ncbi:uncharacterized protein PITG_09879 [Phytophthora infestans T30-4]|uniref:Uncharacterized protein n=1 Tax=Phytophthora infestans (strain T30-4) TaxID=403677 RepID=D0NES8_PHYIT|nr:uncharacterized protein PITG_09879 [Phytophthora infestans T30-4]EEY56360.1 hypothetical protein PITG_09879 [Phytophthora infestans T30-4]|eukprot:XP_002902434.1 hypothetical protein PITG_09879 [Phytophthora infestans T30-4]